MNDVWGAGAECFADNTSNFVGVRRLLPGAESADESVDAAHSLCAHARNGSERRYASVAYDRVKTSGAGSNRR